MSLTVYPGSVRREASGLCVFSGPPKVAVAWSAIGGTVDAKSTHTDDSGRAAAVFTPDGSAQTATVYVTHGTTV